MIFAMVVEVASCIFSLVRRRSNPKAALMIGGLLALPVLVVAIFNLDAVFDFFGRDATLPGRTDVWDLIWEEIQNNYWFGYGYQAVWVDAIGPATRILLTLK